ncbi:spore germination protein KA [Paenibacillus cellulosilyticus]|uniref:Spore germination protein KA n=1 Tax=Paenibacillus cellulosilyticus TaxID=375489 RepID=A0A2V2YYH3_9BACL|nr:spore germination protein [Paenibacillus cellulosilyticus]PWW04782.1 spore germination protein KA [Paenibacillus cellulosilyticus]QKS45905.1 spore germination protein [Paenibacillus cellulosilyticus]
MKSDRTVANNTLSFQKLLSNSSDFQTSDLTAGERQYRLYYLDTMIEFAIVRDHIIQPLLVHKDVSVRQAVPILHVIETELLAEATMALMEGKTIVQVEGEATLYLFGTAMNKERSINIPVNERVLRGSNEALIENLDTNLNLMRKLIATPDLVVRYYRIGRRSNTKIAILYLKSIVNEDIVKELDRRLVSIDIDYIEAPGFIQELMDEKSFSLFPQMLVTERPDRVRSYLMDGKVAILTNGSPDGLILPVSFWAFFQSPDDYQINWLLGSTFRILRIFCFIIAISLPGAYVAMVTFDPRILPFEIALTLQSSMQFIAMPAVLEAVSMLLILEILREATIRLPSPIGQTIGVVGGIVIGTVVVQSNLVSNTMVVVVAFTGIASFIIPSYEMSSAARLLPYPFIFMSAILGLIGLELAYLFVLAHLSRLHMMGVPYFYTGLNGGSMRDTLIRAPIWRLRTRAKESLTNNKVRIRNPRGWEK